MNICEILNQRSLHFALKDVLDPCELLFDNDQSAKIWSICKKEFQNVLLDSYICSYKYYKI